MSNIEAGMDLGYMLQRRRDANNNLLDDRNIPKIIDSISKQPKTKAIKGASLDDFMDMIAKVVSKAMKKDKVEFCPDEGARIKIDMAEKLDHPYIYFDFISRVPKDELKPRIREAIDERRYDDHSKRIGIVYGQKFKCILQFNIIACDYRTVSKVMNNFEELIFNYTAYFKKNGVAEILFEKHFTDTNLDEYRQHVSVRSIQYYVEIEKLFTEFASEIDDIVVV